MQKKQLQVPGEAGRVMLPGVKPETGLGLEGVLCLDGAATTQLEQIITMQKFETNLPFISYFQEKPEI